MDDMVQNDALLPPNFLGWFSNRGWSPHAHQIEMLRAARDGADALAETLRDLMADIRAADPFHQGGGAMFGKADRSRFLQSLDRALTAALRMAR